MIFFFLLLEYVSAPYMARFRENYWIFSEDLDPCEILSFALYFERKFSSTQISLQINCFSCGSLIILVLTHSVKRGRICFARPEKSLNTVVPRLSFVPRSNKNPTKMHHLRLVNDI